ncbi:MAG: O-succinylhomoserine sulfhydrylase [Magnetococcales bacterium]|nr:O-succinylhomoserine sulfhydrylase [Magnetococcales bacterium]MBF0151915.1 O-succinylhomoserine sulfhydrylase [Magnetococcales bacterium]
MKKKTAPDWNTLGSATRALHSGIHRTHQRENSLAMFLTSSYVFESADQARAVFADEEEGNIYSRFTNPTVAAFEEKIAALEGGGKAIATASGMAAINTVFMSLLSSGDHLVLSRSVFGSTTNLANTVLARMGIGVTRVGLSDLDAWEKAIRKETRIFFAETPANPTLELVDIAALAQLARAHGILLVLDNVFCTPCLQTPLELGAHITVHSATKYLDGQGRVLGGAIVGEKELLMKHIYPYLRNTGPSLSPFNAWVLYKGLETLPLRMEKHCDNAEQIVQSLATHPKLNGRIRYPGLPGDPQRAIAQKQMRRFGGVMCLELENRQQAHRFIDGLQLATITANLGDTRTLVTHPATTTHGKLSPQDRLQAGVTEGLVRLSIGLENAEDVLADIHQSLDQI